MAISTTPAAPALRRLVAAGQNIWLDEISRPLIASGRLARLVAARPADPDAAYLEVTTADISAATDLLRPVHDGTEGRTSIARSHQEAHAVIGHGLDRLGRR